MAVTAGDVLQRVADALKKDVGALQSYWTNHVTGALTYATQEVQGRLVARGFTLAQVAAWTRRDEFVSDIALFRALVLGGMLEGFDKTWLDAIDRRKELARVQVFTDDGHVNPGAGSDAPGVVGTGNIVSHGRGEIFSEGADGEDPIRW